MSLPGGRGYVPPWGAGLCPSLGGGVVLHIGVRDVTAITHYLGNIAVENDI